MSTVCGLAGDDQQINKALLDGTLLEFVQHVNATDVSLVARDIAAGELFVADVTAACVLRRQLDSLREGLQVIESSAMHTSNANSLTHHTDTPSSTTAYPPLLKVCMTFKLMCTSWLANWVFACRSSSKAAYPHHTHIAGLCPQRLTRACSSVRLCWVSCQQASIERTCIVAKYAYPHHITNIAIMCQ